MVLTVIGGRVRMQVEGVGEVSDLHIWSLKPGIPLLAAHVTLREGADAHAVQGAVTSACRRLGINHTTVQVRHMTSPTMPRLLRHVPLSPRPPPL